MGVSAMTGKQIQEGLKASEIAKEKGCPVVWGGIHASLLPAQTLTHNLVDYVIEGEGEEAFAELVEALASQKNSKGIRGVWSKEAGLVTFGGPRPFLNINKLPPTPYNLIDLTKYIKPGSYGKSVVLHTSRGCPQRCTFCCNQPLHQSHWRGFSADHVIEEIERIRREHPTVRNLQFWDDNFFANLKRAKDIAGRIGRLRPSITWSVIGAHVRNISMMDDSYLEYLQNSGLKGILVGVESGSQRILNLIQKNFNLEELFFCNKRLKKYNIIITYSFMSGFPGENDEDVRKTVDVIFRLKKDNPHIVTGTVKPFMCYPGTALYKKAQEQGFTPPEHLADWGNFVWGNYLNLDISSVPKSRRRFLTWLYYYTVLMSPRYTFIHSKIFLLVSSILCPLAEWRVKKLCFRFPVEAWLMNMIQRIIL